MQYVEQLCTWSCVLRSPAMYCPKPRGNDTDDVSKATNPGYRNRLKHYFYTLSCKKNSNNQNSWS